MNVLTRGIRNAFRNSIRTFSIVLILGLSIGLTLAMLVARQAVTDKINNVKSNIGNTITVSPAGARGFEGGGEPLTTAAMAKVQSIAHVTAVSQTLSDRLTSTTSNLTSAIEAGTLGQRRANDSGVQFQAPPESGGFSASGGTGGTITRTFTPPVIVTGTNDLSAASVYGGSSVTYTAGQAFDASTSGNVAVLGKALAEKNNLSVGSTFTAYSTTITVVGIFDTGNTFSNAGLLMPLATLQTLSSQTGTITGATVTVDSITNVSDATKAIQSTLGTTADVVNQQDETNQAIQPLESIQKVTLISLIGAMIAGAVIILLTMVMIVRERRREVGVLKAIGASNVKIMSQFIFEAITLTVIGAIVGIGIGIAAAKPLTNTLVTNSTNSSSNSASTGAPTTRVTNRVGGQGAIFRNFSRSGISINNISTTISWTILVYGFGAAFVIAIVGSAIPSFLISKVRPAEVMRAE